jgi:hypothetical protein
VAASDAEFHHGEMNIDEQAATFHLFMRMTVWGSALLAVTLIFLTLHFTAVGLAWFVALPIAFVVGVLIGLGLGMKAAWYATLVGLGALMALIGGLVALVSAFAG